jgi:NADH-quinone oxidoreductase subunit E
MLRRLNAVQPQSFDFTIENMAWIEKQIAKYPSGRQASAVIPVLWRAQEQEGWLTKPAIEKVANLLGMAPIRVFEIASFYFMYQLKPTGSVAHIQICGTTPCMLCESEDLIDVCKKKIAENPHVLSSDGKLSWEEVECLGACANAPAAQIGKDYYEDLTINNFSKILDDLTEGKLPKPGSQSGRFSSEPEGNLSSLKGKFFEEENASVSLATKWKDTIKRITS